MSSTNCHVVGRKTLYDLVRSNRWDAAMARMRTEECGEDLRRKDNVYRRLPLHWASGYGAPLECVEAMVERYPEAVRVTDDKGSLPLHFACAWGRDVSPGVVRLLLNAYPEGAKVTDKGGDLPLHWAAGSGSPLEVTPLEVFRMLLDAHPEGAAARNNNGKYPLHKFIAGDGFSSRHVDIVELLLRPLLNDEEACLVPTGNYFYETPLHVAARFNILRLHTFLELPRCPPDVIMMVAKQHPGQLRESDDDGNLPLHIAAANPNLNGAKVEGMVRPFSPARDEGKDLISELVKLYPEAAAASNGEGRFPLALAIESGKKWEEGVEALVNSAEHIITVRDGATGLYAFMLAATVDDPCIDTVYSLWRRCPEPKRYILD